MEVFDSLGDIFSMNVPTADGDNEVTLTCKTDILLWKMVVLVSPPGEGPDPLDKIEAKLDRMGDWDLDEIIKILVAMEEKADPLEGLLGAIEGKLDDMEGLDLDEILKILTALEAKADPLEDSLVAIEGKLDLYIGDISLDEIEAKLDKIGGDASEGLDVVDGLEVKLDDMDPKLDDIIHGNYGLEAIDYNVRKIESKLDDQGETWPDMLYMLEYLYATQSTLVTVALDGLEAKLDRMDPQLQDIMYGYYGLMNISYGVEGIEMKLDGQSEYWPEMIYMLDYLYGTHSTIVLDELEGIEAKLDNQPTWSWYHDLDDFVRYQFEFVDLDIAAIEAKIDDGVQPGINEIVEMLEDYDLGALTSIEDKLDTIGPDVDYIRSYMGDIIGSITTNYQTLLGIEAKLDGESGIGNVLEGIEGKLDLMDPKLDDILWSDFGLLAIADSVAVMETKLDTQGEYWPEVALMLEYLYATHSTIVIDGLYSVEEKLDSMGYAVHDILYGNDSLSVINYGIGNIEAKLDGEGGIVDTLDGIDAQLGEDGVIASILYSMESKIDGEGGITYTLEDILHGNYGLEVIYDDIGILEAKIDGDGGIADGVDAIDVKLDESVLPPLQALDFKIDQLEYKVLHQLLYDTQRCLPPIVFTPIEVAPHGKLEEVRDFVQLTLQNLTDMGYIYPDDSAAWVAYEDGVAAYNAGQWRTAGFNFRSAYNAAMTESGACGGQ